MLQGYRGKLLHCLSYDEKTKKVAYEYFEDGLLLVEKGKVKAVGDATLLLQQYANNIPITHYAPGLIIPGLIDTHTHYPQLDVVAAYGEQLLNWLEKYIFPQEMKFNDKDYAYRKAAEFLKILLENGTTTALIFATVHSVSVDAIFAAAKDLNMRIISGKVCMDRHAPATLQDTPQQAYDESRLLIEKWHHCQRLQYAVMPRFAVTSSNEQLSAVGKLLQEDPSLYLHTHLAENKAECELVQELFPESRSYLDVYDQFHLLGERSIFAHGVHLDKQDFQRLAATQSAIAFCPSSNLFLGSGLFPFEEALWHNIKLGLGTDVCAGPHASILITIQEAYKVCQLNNNKLDPFFSFYLATLGGATALQLQGYIGNFLPGKEADFTVIDYATSDKLVRRLHDVTDLQETLFALFMLGDERVIKATYVMGNEVYARRDSYI